MQIDGISSKNIVYQCTPSNLLSLLYSLVSVNRVPQLIFSLSLSLLSHRTDFFLLCSVQLYYELLSTNTITNVNGKMQICQRKQHPLKLISVGIFHFNDDEHFFLSSLLLCFCSVLFATHWVLLLQLACITNVNHISLDHLFMVLVVSFFFHPSTQIQRTYLCCCSAWLRFVSDFQFPTTTKRYLLKCCVYRVLDSILYSGNAVPSVVCIQCNLDFLPFHFKWWTFVYETFQMENSWMAYGNFEVQINICIGQVWNPRTTLNRTDCQKGRWRQTEPLTFSRWTALYCLMKFDCKFCHFGMNETSWVELWAPIFAKKPYVAQPKSIIGYWSTIDKCIENFDFG